MSSNALSKVASIPEPDIIRWWMQPDIYADPSWYPPIGAELLLDQRYQERYAEVKRMLLIQSSPVDVTQIPANINDLSGFAKINYGKLGLIIWFCVNANQWRQQIMGKSFQVLHNNWGELLTLAVQHFDQWCAPLLNEPYWHLRQDAICTNWPEPGDDEIRIGRQSGIGFAANCFVASGHKELAWRVALSGTKNEQWLALKKSETLGVSESTIVTLKNMIETCQMKAWI